MITERKTTSRLHEATKQTRAEKNIRARSVLPKRLPTNFLAELKRPEIALLVAACLLAFIALMAYFLWLIPARRHLANTEAQYRELHAKLRDATAGMKVSENTQASVEEIARSLREFEDQKLPSRAESRTATLEELNNLIRRDGLRLSNGVSFTPLNNDAQPQQNENVSGQQQSARGNNVKQMVYPGIGITLSVEGAYPSVRRFLHDMETSGQFIVINSVQIESVTANSPRATTSAMQSSVRSVPSSSPAPPASPNATPTANEQANGLNEAATTPTGAIVSLRLDMAAYFRPERGSDSERASNTAAPTSNAGATSKASRK